jgi:hypothetical protein
LENTKKLIKSLGFDINEITTDDLTMIRQYVIGVIDEEGEEGRDKLFQMNMA